MRFLVEIPDQILKVIRNSDDLYYYWSYYPDIVKSLIENSIEEYCSASGLKVEEVSK